MPDESAREIGRLLADHERRLRDMERVDQLANSSIENGTLWGYNDGTPTVAVGNLPDGTNGAVVLTGPRPPTPEAPSVSNHVPGGLLVTWSGKFVAGALAPMDYARVDVYTSVTGVVDLASPAGSIPSASGGSVFVTGLNAGVEVQVVLVTWSLAGRPSFQSNPTGGVVRASVTVQDILDATADLITADSLTDYGDEITGLYAQIGRVFRQDEEPDPADSNRPFTAKDLWYDTGDGNHQYVWDPDTLAWIDAQDAMIGEAAADAAAALTAAQAANEEVAGAVAAAGEAAAVAQAANTAALLAEEAAEVATQAVRTRNRIFRQPSAPVSTTADPLVVNDLWVDSDDLTHVPYRWDGNAWVDSDLPSVASVQAAVLAAQQAAVAAALDADADVITAAGQDAQEKATAAGQQAVQAAATAATAAYDVSQGAVLQTTTQAQRGVKISSTGIVGWDSAGAPKFVLNASTGAVTLDGPVLTSAGITGSTVTGGTVQTQAEAQRGVKITSAGLVAYDAAGEATFTVLAATGAVTLKGNLTSGSTITGATVVGSVIRTGDPNTGVQFSPLGIEAYGEDGNPSFIVDAETGATTIYRGYLSVPLIRTGFVGSGGQEHGVVINETGLVTYDPDGLPTLVINGATGDVTMRGSLTSGSTVTGAVITGGTVQTSSAAATGVKITSGGIVAYDDDNNITFTISESGQMYSTYGVLTSGYIYGPILTTRASGDTSRGVVINTAGLTAYNASGTATVVLNGSTGVLSVTGSVIAGGQVNGAVITGGTVQTESTANRGVKITSAGIVAYDNGGAATFTVLASTGAVTLKGNLTSGSTITGAVIQTATTGDRIVIRSDGNAGVIESYIGVAGETPGGLDPVAYSPGTRPGIRLLAGTSTAYPSGNVLSLVPGGSGMTTLADLALSDAGQFQVRIQEVTPLSVTRSQVSVASLASTGNVSSGNDVVAAVNVYGNNGVLVQGYPVSRMRWGNVVVSTNSNGDFTIGMGSMPSTPMTVASGGNGEIITIGSADSNVFTGKARTVNDANGLVSVARNAIIRVHYICMV